MIAYEMLCQTIEDWRAGRRPSIDLSATPVGAAHEYAEVEADQEYAAEHDPQEGVAAYAEEAYGDEGYAEESYAEPQADDEDPAYAEAEVDVEGGYEDVPGADYEDYEYDGAPAPVAAGGTSPVQVGEEDLEDDR